MAKKAGCKKLDRHERSILNKILFAQEKGKKGFSADDIHDMGYPKQLSSLRRKKLIKYHRPKDIKRKPDYYYLTSKGKRAIIKVENEGCY